MSKGNRTREAILEQAVELASVSGLDGVSIGSLARHADLSKSGLFAHFGSKETLQVETLRTAASLFVERVVGPALKLETGRERIRALFDNWVLWSTTRGMRGGCLFVAAAVELDDREGPARDYLVAAQRQWLDTIARCVDKARRGGEFRSDTDPRQFAHDMYAIFLGFHHARRLMRDPEAEERARIAFDRLEQNATLAGAPCRTPA